MRLHLTDAAVRSLKPPPGRQLKVWDTTTPGFGVLVNERSKSWMATYGANRKTKIIGKYPDTGLAAARLLAKKLMLEPGPAEPSIKCRDAVDQFLASCEQRLKERTVKDYRRLLMRHLVPALGARTLDAIKAPDVSRMLDRLKATPSEQNHAHVATVSFFSWCERQHLVEMSPVARLQLPSRVRSRSRTLSEAELNKVWNACERTVLGQITRLCVLLGQRRSEIGSLKWEWLDRENRVVNFPADITKNGRPHTIPYGPMAEAVFAAIPNRGEYLFPGRDDNPTWQGWAKAKRELDKRSGVTNYTLHDLRRSWTSFNAEWTDPHILEQALNHVSGQISGVAAIYNRYSYMPELRRMTEAWETRLQQIVLQSEHEAGGR